MIKRVIITGASSGIGRELALLLKEQAELVLVGRNRERLRELSEQIPGALTIQADLTRPEAAEDVMKRAAALGDGCYPVLVNGAGLAHFGDFAGEDVNSLEEQVAINLVAPMKLAYHFVPWALSLGGGQVINVLSIAATTAFAGAAGYCASKAGALMFSRVLAAEFRAKGLKVTSLIPGSVDTPLWNDKGWSPPKEDMLPPLAVAEAIRDLINLPPDRNVDELVLMPPKGIL